MSAVLAPIFQDILRAFCKPQLVRVSVGYHNPNDSEILDWTTLPVTRKQAADMLRDARARHLKVEQSASGYAISGVMHPGWRY